MLGYYALDAYDIVGVVVKRLLLCLGLVVVLLFLVVLLLLLVVVNWVLFLFFTHFTFMIIILF